MFLRLKENRHMMKSATQKEGFTHEDVTFLKVPTNDGTDSTKDVTFYSVTFDHAETDEKVEDTRASQEDLKLIANCF
eukprot:TRINITY_DN3959_c0_g1_i1.p2 TRINITY_DN3959_c0_g1~~TRINITY_DN3959_c0_g1_i1.p2  ORF type:complete len:77 (-),score=16.88 TRINITY_DN3959_c0_g1_i1:262-492(-)